MSGGDALARPHAAVSNDRPLHEPGGSPVELVLDSLVDSALELHLMPAYHPHRLRFRCPPGPEGKQNPRAYNAAQSPPFLPMTLLDQGAPKAPYPVK